MTSWAENDISKQDLMTMQHDAVRRVREMQRQAMANLERTRSTFSQNQNNTQNEYESETPSENLNTKQNSEHVQVNNQNQNNQNNKHNNNFGNNNSGYIGANQIFGRQPYPPNQPNFQNPQSKSPLGLLNGLFSKNGDNKGGFSDLINGLIPKRDGNSPISKILDALDLDTEKLIIIVLIILLLNDGADYTLILALGYILL